ncbi:hypothetical protein [Streptomyces sp. NPDC051677]|uniref:hypothetical protein n=1 Tax=Streptomyces sp. NPDC051677 TaxID=3365669 RepID=UPI0037D72C0F
MSARRRTGRPVVVETDSLAELVAQLAVHGCPHCGGPADFQPPNVVIDHRPDCSELADPGRLADR